MERGFSPKTVTAYRQDLMKFHEFALKEGLVAENLELKDYSNFMTYARKRGLSESSRARMASSIRTFFRYLLEYGYVQKNPTELLESPRKSTKLPVILSFREIKALLLSPDTGTPKGIRDRAMLELLYATGVFSQVRIH